MPSSSQTLFGGAGEPEWQCEVGLSFYGSFDGLPWHCQKAALEDTTKGISEIYGPARTEENPLALTDSSLPKIYNTPPDARLAFALRATAKDDDDDINPESDNNRKQREFAVEVKGGSLNMSEIPGFVGADDGESQTSRELDDANKQQQKRFSQTLKKVIRQLKHSKCAELFGGYENGLRLIKNTDFWLDKNLRQMESASGSIGVSAYTVNYDPNLPSDISYTGGIRLNQFGSFFSENSEIIAKTGDKIPVKFPIQAGTNLFQGIRFKKDVTGAAFLFLHELLHRKEGNSDYVAEDILATFEKQSAHNQKVFDACFSDNDVTRGRTFTANEIFGE